jgi:hypothetical protein
MANDGNLRVPTSDEAREIGKKGGIASGKARREKADLRRQAQLWLESDVTTDKHGQPMSGAQLMMAVAAREAAKGNPKFWELIRDTAGFKPVDKVMVADVDPAVIDDIERIVNETEGADGNSENEAADQ